MASFDEFFDAEEKRVKQADAQRMVPGQASAPANADSFDSFFDSHQQTQQQAVLRSAVQVNPDQAGEAAQLARRYPAPQEVLLRNLQDVKLQAAVDDASARFPSSPVLAQKMAGLPFAQVAHDDTENLSLIETLLNSFKRGVPGLKQNFSATGLRANANVLDTIGAVEAKMAAGQPVLDSEDPYAVRFMTPGQRAEFKAAALSAAGTSAANIAQRQAEKGAIPSPAVVQRVMQAKGWSDTFSAFLSDPVKFVASIGPESLVQSAPGLVLAAPATVLSGPAAGAAVMGGGSFVTDYGSSLLDALAGQGIDINDPKALTTAAQDAKLMRKVAAQAMAHAEMVGAVDALSAGMASKSLPAKILASRPAAREVANIAAQTGAQGAAGGAGEALGEVASGQDISPGNILAEIAGEGFGAPAEVASMAGARVRESLRKTATAEQGAAQIEQLNGLVQASKVLQRDPETFAQFVESAAEQGPVQDVFISAEALAQSGHAEEVAAASPSVQAQFATALETGADIRIPVAEYATTIAPQSYAQNLVDHLKVEADGFSRAEAQEFMKTQGEQLRAQVEQAMTQQGESVRAGMESVKAEILAQLQKAGRFNADANEQYAALAGAFYATQAQRLGITPQALLERYPLRVQAESPVGQAVYGQEEDFVPAELPPPSQVADDLRGMAAGAYWAQQGGLMIRDPRTAIDPNSPDAHREGDVVGRTPWIPAQEWFARMRDQLGRGGLSKQADIAAAIEKAIRGEKLKAAEQRTVDWMRQELQQMQSAIAASYWIDPADVAELAANGAANGLGVADAEDLAKTARAAELDPAAVERAAVQYENDDAGFMAAVQEVLDANATKQAPDQSPGAGEGRSSAREGETGQGPAQGLIRPAGKGQRGAFTPGANIITLFKAADLSTFLHEFGHFQLEVLADLASQPNAPAEIKADMQALLDWFGVKADTPEGALETWHRMTLDEKRQHHEQFARGFEAYLFEGKAPSIELRGIFQRFRAWLLSVYKQIKALKVSLTPEVRGVMDRLVATEDQIANAEAAASMGLLFKTPEEAAKFGVDWQAYHSQADAATATAMDELAERGLKDMQWLSRAKGRELKKLQKAAEAKRKEVEAEVRAEIMAQPVYQAWQYLTGKHPVEPVEADRYGKLNTADVRARYGTEDGSVARTLAERGMLKADGEDPDITAELFGYDSGDAMMQALATAKPPEEAVASATDQRMLERYGDITSPQALETAANEAVHNIARAKFVATELKALEQANDARANAGTDKKGRPRTVAILPEAARQFAAELIAKLKVRDVLPGQYQAAEAKAGREALKSLKAGDVVGAAREKRNQLINNYATKEALAAQAEVSKALKYFARVENSDSIDSEYRDQIGQLLARFNLKKEPLKKIDGRKTLEQWVAQQQEAGIVPDIPPELLAGLGKQSYKDMTVEEVRGLVDTIKQIEHLGRLKSKLLTARDQRTYEAIRDEIAASIIANGQGRKADTRTPTTNAGRWFQGVRNFGAAHIKAAIWARIMDGNKDGGSLWEHLIRSANERADHETTMRAEATKRLSEILAPVMPGIRSGKSTFYPSIGRSYNREAVLSMALNTGNASNLQRLLGGEGWTIEQLKPVLDTLTEKEWQAVQAVWDHFETYRPLIAAKERRVYGKEPNWVEPTPVVTKFGTLRGGYYPVKYDPAASARAEERADAEEAAAMLKGAYSSATTRRSFTKSRVESVVGRPLLYTMQGLYGGVNEVIHDLAWHEWLIDANRLMRSDKIDTAMRETYGPAAVRQFKTWREAIATGDAGTQEAIDKALGRLRQGVSIAGLGFNVMSAAMQPLGITQSIVRVGAKWVGKGVAQYAANPIKAAKDVQAKSEFMRNRARTRFRELNELRNQVQGQTVLKERLQASAYVLMMKAQQIVDLPTWLGAYEKAMSEQPDEDRAISLADQAVIDAQGGGQLKDLAAIERGGPAAKLFTVFYGFMNTALNLGVAQGMSERSAAKKASDMLMLYTVPAVLGYFLKNALTPGDSGDDEDLLKKLVAAQLEFLFGLFVVGREFAGAAKIATGTGSGDYTGPAGTRLIGDTMKFGQQAAQLEFDDAFRKAAINLTGDAFGLPAAQINRTITGAEALNEGKTANPAALLTGYQEPH